MNAASPWLQGRIGEIQDRMAQAARRSRRDPGQITLVGVIKTVPLERVREALAAGLRDLGENRVQEAAEAFETIGRSARWHMIGNLQRNKAGRAAELFDRVHSIDRIEIAEALARRAAQAGRRPKVMLQVNVSGEERKHGIEPSALPALVEAVAALPALELDGLMSIGARVERAEDARPAFAATRELRDRAARATGVALPELSMGMSQDFEVAIQEGSTMVRVGTALFGARG